MYTDAIVSVGIEPNITPLYLVRSTIELTDNFLLMTLHKVLYYPLWLTQAVWICNQPVVQIFKKILQSHMELQERRNGLKITHG